MAYTEQYTKTAALLRKLNIKMKFYTIMFDIVWLTTNTQTFSCCTKAVNFYRASITFPYCHTSPKFFHCTIVQLR